MDRHFISQEKGYPEVSSARALPASIWRPIYQSGSQQQECQLNLASDARSHGIQVLLFVVQSSMRFCSCVDARVLYEIIGGVADEGVEG